MRDTEPPPLEYSGAGIARAIYQLQNGKASA
jgi:hypothetical protein